MRRIRGPRTRRGKAPTRIRRAAVLGPVLLLVLAGCARHGGNPVRLATASPAALEPVGFADGAEWLARSREGRESLRRRDYAAAERSFVAALVAASSLPDHDVRRRTTLGNLIGLAAVHQRQGRDSEAERVMELVERNAGRDGAPGVGRSAVAHYRARYRSLTQAPQRQVRWPVQRSVRAPRARPPSVDAYDELIVHTARRFRVDPALVKAVVAAESNFEHDAVSRVGAQGLMQLMPETARAMGVHSPFEPHENIRGGVRYLREMLDRYGNVRHALAAYNAGPDAVDRHGGVPPYRETREYIQRVLAYYRGYMGQL